MIIQTQKPARTAHLYVYSEYRITRSLTMFLASLTVQCSNNWPPKRTREMTLDVATAKPRAHATRNLRINITVTATAAASVAAVVALRERKENMTTQAFSYKIV